MCVLLSVPIVIGIFPNFRINHKLIESCAKFHFLKSRWRHGENFNFNFCTSFNEDGAYKTEFQNNLSIITEAKRILFFFFSKFQQIETNQKKTTKELAAFHLLKMKTSMQVIDTQIRWLKNGISCFIGKSSVKLIHNETNRII